METAHQRFTRWAADGTWARMRAEVIALAELDDDIDWDDQVDATIVRTHQHAAGAVKRADCCRDAGTRKHRPLPWWADHQNPHPGRRTRPVAGHPHHARSSR